MGVLWGPNICHAATWTFGVCEFMSPHPVFRYVHASSTPDRTTLDAVLSLVTEYTYTYIHIHTYVYIYMYMYILEAQFNATILHESRLTCRVGKAPYSVPGYGVHKRQQISYTVCFGAGKHASAIWLQVVDLPGEASKNAKAKPWSLTLPSLPRV